MRIPAFFFLGFWFVQQAFYGVASLQTRTNIGIESGGIAYWAHAEDFVFGAILGPLFGLYKRDYSVSGNSALLNFVTPGYCDSTGMVPK